MDTSPTFDDMSERLLESDSQGSPPDTTTLAYMRTPLMWNSPRAHPLPQPKNRNALLSSTFSLVSTIIGAGVLSLPYGVEQAGLVLGLLLIALTAVLSRASCTLLLSAYLRTHKGSYDDLADHLFGRWMAVVVQLTIILLNMGGSAGYMLVIKDLLGPSLCLLMNGIHSHSCYQVDYSTTAVAILVYGVVYPLSCLETLSSLQVTSKLAFTCACFLAVAISLRTVQMWTSPAHETCHVNLVAHDLVGVFRALPLFAFSFVCHLNVLPVYDELRSRTPGRMKRVITQAMLFCFFFYASVGGFGYARACDRTPNNILAFPTRHAQGPDSLSLAHPNNTAEEQDFFPLDDTLILAARIAETLTCMLALPFLQFPNRLAFHNMIKSIVRCVASAEGESIGVTPATTISGGNSRVEHRFPVLTQRWVRWVESLVLISLSFVLALTVPNLPVIFGFMGSTLCSLICFILPPLFYLRSVAITKRSQVQHQQHLAAEEAFLPDVAPLDEEVQHKIEERIQFKIAAAVLLITYGIAIMVIGTKINIDDAIAAHHSKH